MAKGKIAMAIGFPKMGKSMDKGEGDMMDEGSSADEADSQSETETMAMKQFMRAESAAEKASAMKDFLEACGVC